MQRLLLLFLFMLANLALSAQIRHITTDGRLELYVSDSGYSIYVSNKYNTPIGISYKYAVSVISKENKKEIDSYVVTDAYGCVEANNTKQLKNFINKLPPNSNYFLKIINVYIDNSYEIKKCND